MRAIATVVLVAMTQAGPAKPAPGSADPAVMHVRARSLQPGDAVLLTFVTAAPADALSVRAFGRTFTGWKKDDRTWEVLVGIDLDVRPGRSPVVVTPRTGDRRVEVTKSLTISAKTFPTRQLTVDQAFVNPPAEALPRIERDTRELERRWKESAPTRLWSSGFVRPVPDDANSAFGTRSVYNGEPRSPHSGADFRSPAGTPVKAPNSGRVVLAEDLYFTGKTVVIDHGLGLFSLIAHLSAIDVREGDTVSAGQIVGKVGATGRVTGPHLHWAIRLNGARVDPLSLLAILAS
jgi:murein DD-endopeptidase MepM/ murein hydrolase activator NlpD